MTNNTQIHAIAKKYNAREAIERHIPDEIWAVVLPADTWSTENGTWFASQSDLLEHLNDHNCMNDLFCVTSNIREKATGTRVYCTHHPFEVEEWLSDWKAERAEEERLQRYDRRAAL